MALKTHRQGNDFKLTLQVYRLNDAISVTTDTVPDGAIPEDLTEAQNIKISLYCSTGACTVLKKTVNVNTIVAEIPTNIQDIGTYFVLLEYDIVDSSFADGLKRVTVDFDAFKIVCKSAYADTEGDMSLIGVIKVGLDGKSAYQYAQEHGYTGTEEEFGQLQYDATLAAINEAERIIAESNREQTFNTQMDAVDTAIGLAGTATDNANMAATNANDKAILANNAATNADSKAQLAETAASNADIATGLANAATANANNAASNADNKAGLADQKATLANNAAISANTATGNANTATTNANNAALAANSLAGTYNVTVAMPLGEGLYYNSATARAAVPTANRLLGRVITYATASGVWYTEKFIGTDVSNWTTEGNWERVPDNSQLVQLGADLINTLKCVILIEEEYFALTSYDPKTMYVITGINETTGALEITSAYLGELKFATGGGSTDNGIPIEILTLSDSDITIEKGATKLITASWHPTDATKTALSWISNNTLVATVASGAINAVGKGSATITVKAQSGVKNTINVTVIVTLSALSIESPKTDLVPSESVQIVATPTPSDADIDLTFTSSHPLLLGVEKTDANKATVNANVTGSGVLTVLTGTTTPGFIFLKLDRIIEIPVTAGKTAIQIADQIRSMTIDGWILSGTQGSNVVNFVKSGIGLCYLPALNDAVTAAEVDTLEIATIPTASGNITINLDGVDFVVAIDNTVQTSRTATASKIAATTFAGWTVTSSNKVVTFTNNATGRRVYPTLTDTGSTGVVGTWRRPTRGDTSTGVTSSFISNDVNIIDVTATDVKGKFAKVTFNLKPYSLTVDSNNIDETDNSVTSIFTNWNIERTSNITLFKYKEYYMNGTIPYIYQQSDYASIPDNNQIQVELYAEFGNRIIEFTFCDSAGNEIIKQCNIYYKELELIDYSFNVDVTCTSEEAAAMTAEIPFFKYDKKYAQALRNDDGRPSMWRTMFRYCNRDLDLRTIPMTGNLNSTIINSLSKDTLRSPRRLCYTDGTGIKKVFVFDTAGVVTEGDGRKIWEKTEYWDGVNEDDFWKLKDYGGHFLLHNMCILSSDAEHYTAKNNNDYTYALQRDRQAIFDKFGYTSLHFCNPDGDWYYTRPVIKDPRTLLMSGGGSCYNIDPDGIFGKPSNRTVYGDDLSNVPLYEIRNTLLINYGFHSNWFDRNDWITQQYNYKNYNQKRFKAVLTHCAGYTNDTNNTSADLINSYNYFQEIHDKVGANGLDEIWMCSGDEMIEYMYYQRCATVTKTITPTGCRFTVALSIPNYLGFKTYSLLLKNLPSTATVSYSDETPLTYFSKNLTTGLINWGYSPDILERTNRYIAAYVASPTNEKLDKAWYFVRQMGEMGTALATQLPILNESPVIDSITYNAKPTDSSLVVTAVNSNKEFGEAEYLDISLDDTFSNKTAYQIPYSDHKFYDSTNPESLRNSFTIKIGTDFGVTQLYYTRLRNIYGVSNVKQMPLVLTRTSGINDPAIEFIAPDMFKSDTEGVFTVTHSYISAMRYKLTDTFTEWMSVTDSITIPMTKGTTYNLVVQGKNNLDEIVERAYTVNFPGKQVRIILANVASSGNIDGVGYVNNNAIPNNTKVTNYIYDTEGNKFCLNLDRYSGNSIIKSAFATKFNSGSELVQFGNMSYSYVSNTVISGNEGYPETMIKGATNLFAWGGTTTVPETRYVGQRLYNVPTGTYRVRMMYRCWGNIDYPYNYKANDVVVSKVNVSKTKDTTEWVTLDNVVVDSTGYLYIGMNPQPATATNYSISQLAMIVEITKIG